MKKLLIILILTLGIICESKAQKNSEIYYYQSVDPNTSWYDVRLVQIQDYGKKMVEYHIYESKDLDNDVYEEVQKALNKYDWIPGEYSQDYSNDTYDTYSCPYGMYFAISKDRETLIHWRIINKTPEYYKRISITDIQEMSKVKLPDFLE